MIQHRKEGRRFITELEEELANRLPGVRTFRLFIVLPGLCAVANHKSSNKNTVDRHHYIAVSNRGFYDSALRKWQSQDRGRKIFYEN